MKPKVKVKGALTFKEATDAAIEKGRYIRHPGMGPGWTIGAMPQFNNDLFCFNPHTGSEYAYTSSPADREREDWYVAKNKRDEESLGAA